MAIADISFLLLGTISGAAIFWLLARGRNRQEDTTSPINDLQAQVTSRLDRITEQLDRRLRENAHAMNESKSFLANRVSSAERTVREVGASLSKLEQTTSSLKENTDEITSFQQLLRSPKVRGSFGEVLLNNLLADVLPADRFSIQHTLPTSGEIADAIIKLQDGYIVAIDAKFPLANFEAFNHESDPVRKKNLRTQLTRDTKKHVADISRKYISPRDHTLDYAFMYIPAEGVYYETMVHDPQSSKLWEYCLQHKIVPVSPNSFLAYLQTVLIGLRGMKIEQQAKEILQHLGQLSSDFGKFADEFSMVGTHLTNAKNRYDDSARRLDKFGNRLDQIGQGTAAPQITPPEEK